MNGNWHHLQLPPFHPPPERCRYAGTVQECAHVGLLRVLLPGTYGTHFPGARREMTKNMQTKQTEQMSRLIIACLTPWLKLNHFELRIGISP